MNAGDGSNNKLVICSLGAMGSASTDYWTSAIAFTCRPSSCTARSPDWKNPTDMTNRLILSFVKSFHEAIKAWPQIKVWHTAINYHTCVHIIIYIDTCVRTCFRVHLTPVLLDLCKRMLMIFLLLCLRSARMQQINWRLDLIKRLRSLSTASRW